MEQTPRPRKRKAPTSVTPDVEADVDGALIAENLLEKRWSFLVHACDELGYDIPLEHKVFTDNMGVQVWS